MNNNLFFYLFLIPLISSILILVKLDYLSKKFSLIDVAKNKIHSKDTPKYGFFVFSIILFFIYLSNIFIFY